MRWVQIESDFREIKLHVTKRGPAVLVLLALVFAASAAAQEQPSMRCDNFAGPISPKSG